MQIMENGTLHIEDIKDEDSGNYSCTIIFYDQRMETEQFFLQLLKAEDLKTEPPNSTLYTTTLKPSVETRIPGTALIAIPVCSAFAIILIVAAIFIFKCRKKCCCTSEEPIYANKTAYNSRK
ncbi:hypothetical protein R3I94_007223 [Phoxinus phoxinus]|uniref:Uncharacterized protein n=1 Tax=Phoxinus phoxinus TaxID=58324 RepID=A0AAN9D9Y2_9TELE